MSAAQHTAHAGHDHHDDHGDHHGDVGPHSSLRDYTIGFVLSVILTAIPFWLVMAKVIADRNTAVLVLGAFAVVQILVHMVYFLHMNGKVEGGWTMLSTIFTVVWGWGVRASCSRSCGTSPTACRRWRWPQTPP